MLECTDGYRGAIVGDMRKIYLRALIDIIDPDIAYAAAAAQSESAYSRSEQLHDKIFAIQTPYATLEPGRWRLDGTLSIYPDAAADIESHVGFQSGGLSGADGAFAPAEWVEMRFSGVSLLQACSVYFPSNGYDGLPTDFKVEVKQGGTAYYSKTYTGNLESSVSMDGFTVYDPDAIRVTVTKWSIPQRRFRAVQIVPGVYEDWKNDIICEFSVTQQADFSCLSLPYGTCTLKMDNLSRRFEPRSKNGLFQSIEERQGIPVFLGLRLPDGTAEYQPAGVYYQYNGGWKTGDNGLSMQWELADIVGLLADREFLPPAVLPTTLSSWLAALAEQLGTNFAGRYRVDPAYGDLPVTASAVADVTGKKCGDLLRFICMVTGTFPRADAATGYLTAEPTWNQGNQLDLDNMATYPVMKANNDLAMITFKLHDAAKTTVVVGGNSTAASATVSVDNPFLHTQSAALTAAKIILSTYGGNVLDVTGRGDMSSEIGDVDTVWLNESSATTGRRRVQSFSISGGVLQNCGSELLQADGSFLYQNRAVLTDGGTWTAPVGADSLRLILVGGGQNGTGGTDGTFNAPGTDGVDGAGGKVWAGTVSINAGQTFAVTVGQGGADGGTTAFGAYSSANGSKFESYTDIDSGNAYARTGVASPLAGSGDGGAKGLGGAKGEQHWETTYGSDGKPNGSRSVTDVKPGKGTAGVAGQSGCVVLYYDKEAKA